MSNDRQQLITAFFSDLIGTEPDIEIDFDESQVVVSLQVDSIYSGSLIGYRGEVLSSIQLILGLILNRGQDTWLPVRVNINDYREQREKALESLANNAAYKAASSGQQVQLPSLSSYERRIIHAFLTDRDDVITFSQGEPPLRILVISPR